VVNKDVQIISRYIKSAFSQLYCLKFLLKLANISRSYEENKAALFSIYGVNLFFCVIKRKRHWRLLLMVCLVVKCSERSSTRRCRGDETRASEWSNWCLYLVSSCRRSLPSRVSSGSWSAGSGSGLWSDTTWLTGSRRSPRVRVVVAYTSSPRRRPTSETAATEPLAVFGHLPEVLLQQEVEFMMDGWHKGGTAYSRHLQQMRSTLICLARRRLKWSALKHWSNAQTVVQAISDLFPVYDRRQRCLVFRWWIKTVVKLPFPVS